MSCGSLAAGNNSSNLSSSQAVAALLQEVEQAVQRGDLNGCAAALLSAEEGGVVRARGVARSLRAQLWTSLGYPPQLCPRGQGVTTAGAANTVWRRDECTGLLYGRPRRRTSRAVGLQDVKLVVVGEGGVGKTHLHVTALSGVYPQDYCPANIDAHRSNMFIDGCPVSLSLWDTAGQADYNRLRPFSYPGTDFFVIAYSVDRRSTFEAVTQSWMPELAYHYSTPPSEPVDTAHIRRGDTEYMHPQSWTAPYCSAGPLPPIALIGLRTDLRDGGVKVFPGDGGNTASMHAAPADSALTVTAIADTAMAVSSGGGRAGRNAGACVSTEEGLQLARRIGACYFDECSAKCGDADSDCMKIFRNCARLAVLSLESSVPSAAQTRTRKRYDVVQGIRSWSKDWWQKPRVRILGCRQRLALSAVLHARLARHSLDCVHSCPWELWAAIGAALFSYHRLPTLDVSIRNEVQVLRAKSMAKKPTVTHGAGNSAETKKCIIM